MSKQERELDAAEYVIGTMSTAERRAFEASMESDEQTRADVGFWERTFGALNASVSPVAPPDDMWDRIEAELKENGTSSGSIVSGLLPGPANDNVIQKLMRSRRRWRMSAIAASLAAIGLGAYVANNQLDPISSGQDRLVDSSGDNEFIAVVNANGDQPSLVVTVNAKTKEVSVRTVGVDRPDGKSLELWYVPEGQKAISVGLVGEGQIDLKEITAKGGDLLAISLEPKGGSPTGTATGPVIYTGKLIKNIDAN